MKQSLLFLSILFIAISASFIYEFTQDVYRTVVLTVEMSSALGVLAFALMQVSLNHRLIGLQDYVAVSIVLGGADEKGVRFYNTGKINIYIHRIEVRDSESDKLIIATDVFKDPRLLPAGTLEASYYWFPLPRDVLEHKNFRIVLLLSDELNRKWLSSHGGEINEKKVLRVWSHKTHQKNWKVYKKEEKVPQ